MQVDNPIQHVFSVPPCKCGGEPRIQIGGTGNNWGRIDCPTCDKWLKWIPKPKI